MLNPSQLFDLSGKRALVTGARTGIGQQICVTLAAAGCDIIGLGTSPMPETEKQVLALGKRFQFLELDLSSQNEITDVIKDIGFIDILVNNAGQISRDPFSSVELNDWNKIIQINLTAAFQLGQSVANNMIKRDIKGRIINISSVLSEQGGSQVVPYVSSKHGITGLTRSMANDLASFGITVNALCPGYIETANTLPLRQDAQRSEDILSRIPKGRWGKPHDLSTAILFLCSDFSGYVTGSSLFVDGGWSVR